MNENIYHKSVMIDEVIASLKPSDNEVYVDCTVGAGGHSKNILDTAKCRVIGIDKDPEAISICKELQKLYADRFSLTEGSFGNIKEIVNSAGINFVNGILLDLGVSSMQLSSPERGFSFKYNSPLDMRMNKRGEKAYDLINSVNESSLADIIFRYGEERKSRKIAKEIVKKRKVKKISTTSELSEIIASAVRFKHSKIHPATKTFQALRIYLNDELMELYKVLVSSEELLTQGGRLVVIAFHSLEDRIVKNFIRYNSVSNKKYDILKPKSSFVYVSRKVIRPSREEIELNKRARSARLRCAFRSSLSLDRNHHMNHDFQKYGGV